MKEGGNYVVANGSGRIEHGGDSDDSKDSDAVQLFELPKRKLVRPISSSLRRKVRDSNACWATTKECCRVFVTVTVPMLVAVFIVSTILCLAFLLVGIAGMKQEISILKSRLKNVDAAEQNFLVKKEQLRKQFRDKLNDLVSYQTELQKVQSSVRKLASRLDQLNMTIHRFHRKPAPQLSSKVTILKNDLDTVKTGMADTGSDIEKLKANGKETGKNVKILQDQLSSVKQELYNMTVQISWIEHKAPPSLQTTPKMLVVTLSPDLDKPVIRRELNSRLDALEKRSTESCKKEVSLYDYRLEKLRNETLELNETYSNEMSHLRHYLYTLKQHPAAATTTQPTLTAADTAHALNSTGNATIGVVKTISPTTRTVTPLQKSSSSIKLQTVNVTSEEVVHENKSNIINTTSVANLTQLKPLTTNATHRGVRASFNDIRSDERLEMFKGKKVTRRKRRSLLNRFESKSKRKSSRTNNLLLHDLDARNPV